MKIFYCKQNDVCASDIQNNLFLPSAKTRKVTGGKKPHKNSINWALSFFQRNSRNKEHSTKAHEDFSLVSHVFVYMQNNPSTTAVTRKQRGCMVCRPVGMCTLPIKLIKVSSKAQKPKYLKAQTEAHQKYNSGSHHNIIFPIVQGNRFQHSQ